MFFRRFYDDGLAQASYLIGCDASGEAVVIDPNRDVAQYLDAAAAEAPPHHAGHGDPHPRRLRLRKP